MSNALGWVTSQPASLILFPEIRVTAEDSTEGHLGFMEKHTNGLANAFAVTVSADGQHVYASGDAERAVNAFRRDSSSGRLTFIHTLRQDQSDDFGAIVRGLEGGMGLEISSDGQHVYATGREKNAVAAFSRDPATGRLRFVEVLVDGQTDSAGKTIDGLFAAEDLALAPDGAHVYVAGQRDNAVAVFRRNANTGELVFEQALKSGQPKPGGGVFAGLTETRGVVVSPDGGHVYTAGYGENTIVHFTRDSQTGRLTFGETSGGDLWYAFWVGISPDGLQVYSVLHYSAALVAYSRDPVTGRLSPREILQSGATDSLGNRVTGIANPMRGASSPDGRYVFVPGNGGDALVVFRRDFNAARLTFVQALADNQQDDGGRLVDGLSRVADAAVSPDGRHVYTAASGDGALAVFVTEVASIISDGDMTTAAGKNTDYGVALLGEPGPTRTYRIWNDGLGPLALGAITVPIGFTLVDGPTATLLPGESDTFTVRLDTDSLGTKTGEIVLPNNDEVENPFNFQIRGTVRSAPVITFQPQDQAAAIGTNATFTVEVSGTPPFTYQWFFNGSVLTGATSVALTVTNVQLLNAGAYLVAITNAVGSTVSATAMLNVYTNYGRFVRIVTTNTSAGATIDVPIQLGAVGNENAIGLSVGFDPSVLTLSSVTPGIGAPGAILNLNNSQLANGRLGFTLALPSGVTFTAGTQEVVKISFTVAANSGDISTPLRLLDQPVFREVSDVLAEPLATTYLAGGLNVGGAVEGDVAPLPNGNGLVTATDWVKIGRYAAGLDAADDGIQFQRADCAPRSSAGGGTVTVSDWVQAGRYVAALDPTTPAGGPTAPNAAPQFNEKRKKSQCRRENAAAINPSRTLRIESAVIQRGTSTEVSVILESAGNESAMGFSIMFDPQGIDFIGAVAGADVSGATLNLNTNQASAGRIGAAIALAVGNSFTAGRNELLTLSFHAAPTLAMSKAISFADTPVLREVSDAVAHALPTEYVGAMLALPEKLLRLQAWGELAGRCRILISNADGTTIDSQRVGKIEILTTTNVPSVDAIWQKRLGAFVFSEGVLQFDETDTNQARRFYRALEQP